MILHSCKRKVRTLQSTEGPHASNLQLSRTCRLSVHLYWSAVLKETHGLQPHHSAAKTACSKQTLFCCNLRHQFIPLLNYRLLIFALTNITKLYHFLTCAFSFLLYPTSLFYTTSSFAPSQICCNPRHQFIPLLHLRLLIFL